MPSFNENISTNIRPMDSFQRQAKPVPAFKKLNIGILVLAYLLCQLVPFCYIVKNGGAKTGHPRHSESMLGAVAQMCLSL
jgi:hypothetical protein